VEPKRESLFERYEAAVHAYTIVADRSRKLLGAELYVAIRELDQLHREVEQLESALAEYDDAMR
jgi:hypothetical protein